MREAPLLNAPARRGTILDGEQAGRRINPLRGVLAWRHAIAARVQSQSMDSRTVDLRSGAVAVDAERTTGTVTTSGECFARRTTPKE